MEGRQLGRTRNRKYWRRNKFYLGTWNVLSLYRAGALRLLVDQIDIYETGIRAIQEIRWIGQGTLEKKDHTLFYRFYIHCSVHHCNCLKNNQHDVTCGLSFIFMVSRHSFSTCFELSGSSSSGDHFSCTVSLWYSV